MPTCQITHIRLSTNFFVSNEKITHVKLSDGSIESIAHAVKFIDDDYLYYYVNSLKQNTLVEAVHPNGRVPYIRTKANNTTIDNLLNLPTF